MNDSELDLDLDELSSAEDFLEYFSVPFDSSVVHVNRLHILQRFHDYMSAETDMPEDDEARFALYKENLTKAYQDFVESDALTEKVFKVFKPQEVVVPANILLGGGKGAS